LQRLSGWLGAAAGLGLAWLAHSLGFGAEFGQLLMFGLIAMAVVALILRPRNRAELLAGIIGDERIDVAWFKVAWGRLPVGEGVWTQETHGPNLAIKNYLRGRGAA
jgi:hypothetical protein